MSRGQVIVVGGGPAGLVAAIAARRRGFGVMVVDARTPPIDKPCGEGILPQGVAALRKLGLTLPSECALPFQGIRFVSGAHSAQADFPGATGFSMRRVRLHQFLADRASEEGVQFRWNTRVTRIDSGAVYTANGPLPYRWLIGADGQHSAVRRWAGLDPRQSYAKRFGFCTHFQIRPWSDFAEVHWSRDCQIFVTPMTGTEVGIAVISRDPALRLEKALLQFPALAAKLKGIATTTRESGETTALRRFPSVARGAIALVGDASGSVDALTGYGLSLSFQQSIALAGALDHGDLSFYQQAHRRISAVPTLMTRLMLLMAGNDWIRERTIRLFEKSPALFARMLAIHSEAEPISSVRIRELAGFGWKFLTV